MVLRFLILMLVCLLPFREGSPQVNAEDSSLKSIDSLVSKFIRDWNIPGASLAMAKDGRLVYARAFGYADKENREIVTPDHRFRIASLSKFITAVAVMNLAEQGKLRVEDKVFGPAGILNDPVYGKIKDKRLLQVTVRQLLQHTGGWDRDVSGDPMVGYGTDIARAMKVKAPADPQTVIRYMLGQKLDFTPGTKYSYSNLGYCILGRVIEKLSGMPYSNYVQTVLFAPLNITAIQPGKNLYCDKLAGEVRYYDEGYTSSCYCDRSKVNWPYGGFNLEAMDAHGGWVASSRDFLKFIVSAGGSSGAAHIISPSSVKMMTSSCSLNSNYGMGCQVNSAGNIWHTGALPGSSSMMANLSNGISWVILLNGRPVDANYYSALDELMWKSIRSVKIWPSGDLFVKKSPS
ncbi:MAG: serine hydrolase domain-containing protein [Cytophagaceae bacterium]